MDAFNTPAEGTLVSLAMELKALDSETFEIQDYAEYDGLMGAPAKSSPSQGGNGNTATSTSSTSTCSTCSTTSCCA
jgi:thiazolylpeptide-type bacteriocin precursor